MGYKLIVAGGRTFNDYEFLKQSIDELQLTNLEIVSGKARGADSLGERYARERGLVIHEFPAEWSTYGKSAGYRRNADMANFANGCICFWDEKSKGTKHMIDLAMKKELDLTIKTY